MMVSCNPVLLNWRRERTLLFYPAFQRAVRPVCFVRPCFHQVSVAPLERGDWTLAFRVPMLYNGTNRQEKQSKSSPQQKRFLGLTWRRAWCRRSATCSCLLRQAIGWYHFFISSTARRGLVGHWQNSFRELERGRVRVWGGKVTKQVNKPTLSLKTAMCRWFLILDWRGGQLSKQTLL